MKNNKILRLLSIDKSSGKQMAKIELICKNVCFVEWKKFVFKCSWCGVYVYGGFYFYFKFECVLPF